MSAPEVFTQWGFSKNWLHHFHYYDWGENRQATIVPRRYWDLFGGVRTWHMYWPNGPGTHQTSLHNDLWIGVLMTPPIVSLQHSNISSEPKPQWSQRVRHLTQITENSKHQGHAHFSSSSSQHRHPALWRPWLPVRVYKVLWTKAQSGTRAY